jgi:hypothetical protein
MNPIMAVPQPPKQDPDALTAVRDMVDAHAGKLPTHGQESNRKKSAGETLFDRTVYTGIGFGVNEASSLWITDQFVHGSPKWWLGGEAFSKAGFDAASNYIAKAFNMSKPKAGNSLLMAALLSGGTLLVLPMRHLEEHKIYYTQKANHLIDWATGNKMNSEQVQARDQDVAQAIACSPQQTWASLLAGRAAAMLTCWTTGSFLIGPKRNKKIMDWSETALTGAANASGFSSAAKTDAFKRYARLTGVETYSCALSSVVLELGSKLFASHGTEVHDPEICKTAHEDNPPIKQIASTLAPLENRSNAEKYRKEKEDCGCKKKPESFVERARIQQQESASHNLAV